MPVHQCECSDPRCPFHEGEPSCNRPATRVLVRIDLQDRSGIRFCKACAEDAESSGLFTDFFEFFYQKV